jgi:zinc protease
MKKNNLFIFCLILIFALASLGQAGDLKLPKVNEKTLKNGLDVYIIEQTEVPVVSIRLVIPGGSCYENEEIAGLANLTSGLLRKGTKSRTANEVSEEIDFIGGSLGAGASTDAINATCTVLSKHLDKGLELLADIVVNPVFDDEEVDRLKDQIVGAIMQSKSDPGTIRSTQFAKYLFGDHPYGLPAIGTEETMLMLTSDDVKEFYNKYVIPNNAFLLVVGDVKPKDVMKLAAKYFDGWKQGTAVELNLPDPPKIEGRKVFLIDKPDATQSFIAMGHLGLSRLNPDAFSTRAMNYILGGGGFASRMMKSVRGEEGLTYGIGSSFDFKKYPGKFSVTTFTKNESTAKTMNIILDELNKIRNETVTDKELADCQSFYSGYLPLQFETASQIASWMETIFLYDLGTDYYANYIKTINNTTPETAQQMAQKYIDTENMLIVVVGKAEDVKTQLEEFGEVTVIPLIEL